LKKKDVCFMLDLRVQNKQLHVMWYGDPSFFLRECAEEKIKRQRI
jgi:hypothetical protein